MHKTIHLPLGIHFILAAQRKFVHAFIYRDITKHRFYRTESFAVLSPSCTAIYFYAHFIGIGDGFSGLVDFKLNLSPLFARGFTHTLWLQWANSAIF